jgi:DNA polymerase III epsilon subunit-like protein
MLHFCRNRPWQVGVIKAKGDKIVESHDLRVRWNDAPHLKIGVEAAAITRFNPQEHERLAIQPKAAFDVFWPLLQEADYIIGHNILKFDLYLLKGYAEFMGVDWKWITSKILDTRAIAQGIKLEVPYKPEEGSFLEWQYRVTNTIARGVKTSLKSLGPEYGIQHDYERLHDAIVDLELNFKVWQHLKKQIEI